MSVERWRSPAGLSGLSGLSGLVPSRTRPRAGYVVAVVGNLALTLALLAIRDETTPISKGFGLMAVVILAAVLGGLGPGVVASVMGFLLFNFVFIPPYGSFSISRMEDVVVLFVFLGLSVLISAILSLERERREASETREAELEILKNLSHQLVLNPPGPSTYRAALTQVVSLFGFESGAILTPAEGTSGLIERAAVGSASPAWDPEAGPAPLRLPLNVERRTLGLLVLDGDRPPLRAGERRVLGAFGNELAQVLERDRLLALAGEAEEYRRTDDVRRALFGAVSHELRSPLAAIKASVTDLLDEDAPPSAEYREEALRAVNNETDRLDRLITNLLDMSRIDAGILRARVQASDLSDSVTRCAERLARWRPDYEVKAGVPDGAVLVRADPVFLERVVSNLLDNACNASGPGVIEVAARREEEKVTVRVVDHGRGIPPAAREHIFHPFYGLDQKEAHLGPGLGLAICRGFLKAMGGDIWVEDTPGGGATLAFSLPAAGPPGPA